MTQKQRKYFYRAWEIFFSLLLLALAFCLGRLVGQAPLNKICKEQTFFCERECISEASDIFICPEVCEKEFNKCITK